MHIFCGVILFIRHCYLFFKWICWKLILLFYFFSFFGPFREPALDFVYQFYYILSNSSILLPSLLRSWGFVVVIFVCNLNSWFYAQLIFFLSHVMFKDEKFLSSATWSLYHKMNKCVYMYICVYLYIT